MRLYTRAPIRIKGRVPPLSERQVLRALRIPHHHAIDEIDERGVREAVLKAALRASHLDAYEAVFRTLPVERRTDEAVVVHGSETLLRSPSLRRLLADARHVTALAVTLGPVWDEALDALAARDEPAEAWFLDALGVRMLDQAARAVEERVGSDMAREGLERTGRYRPGYGDWSLEAQEELCALIDAAQIGVRLNEAYALLPRTSVTGVVGWCPRQEPGAPQDPGAAGAAGAGDTP